jgi:tRNA pseudouridine38-40 synthase
MRYRLVVSYDGTAYRGWQRQPHESTVVGVLEDAYRRVFNRPISIVGASRTDAGVHAMGQVAAATLDLDIEPARLLRAWQAVLPGDIYIRRLDRVDDSFHPQRSVVSKRYVYYFSTIRPLPHLARYVAYHHMPVDLDRLQRAADIFVGSHDFRSFCTGNDRGDDTVRRIDSIRVRYHARWGIFSLEFQGPGFLRYMIRRITGAVLQVVSDDILKSTDEAVARLQQALHECHPAQQLVTAPAHGLVLHKIRYIQD